MKGLIAIMVVLLFLLNSASADSLLINSSVNGETPSTDHQLVTSNLNNI